MLNSEQSRTSRARSKPQSRDTLSQFTDAATEAVARTIANFQREGRRERELRDAQFAARMAELGYRIESVADLERRLVERLATLKDGRDGTDAVSLTIEDVRPAIADYVDSVLAGWERPRDGKSVTVDEVQPILRDLVSEAVAAIPPPKDGKDGRDGVDGRDVDPDVIRQMITEAVALIPAPKDGRDGTSVTMEDVLPVIREAVAAIPRAKDGRDGKDGMNGKDVDHAEIERLIAEAVAALPPAQPGKDADPDLVAELVSETVRSAIEALPPPEKGEKGDPGPVGALPVVEAWEDRVYYQGEAVTLDGALYQAVRDTGKVPGHKDWRCIVRRGADGEDGRSFSHEGTYDPSKTYRALNVVALNGASFSAKRDDPGPCPGDGWQLVAAQGKQGKPGAKGSRGDQGPAGPALTRLTPSDDGVLTAENADGSIVECDLYPLLSKIGG